MFRAYDGIHGSIGMTEALFQSDFEPRIQEMTDEVDRLEEALTSVQVMLENHKEE